MAKVEPCNSDEALQFMPNRIVVVDDVNTSKKLFHIVLGPGKVSDVVRFDQTGIRPNIGDFLRISYCIKKNKEGKKDIFIEGLHFACALFCCWFFVLMSPHLHSSPDS